MAKLPRESIFSTGNRVVGSVIIFALALIARLVYLNALSDLPSFGYLTFDLIHFHSIATAMVQGQPLGHEAVFKAPLYSLFLAQLYSLASSSLFKTLAIQCVLGSLSPALVFLIASEFYSRKIATTAGIVTALYGTLIFFDAELLPVALTVFLLLITLYQLLKYESNHRRLLLVGAGITLALAGAATPETLILVPVFGYWVYQSSNSKRGAQLTSAAIFVAATLLMTVPFALRNNSLGGEKLPYLTDIGVRLAIANHAGADGRSFALPNSVPEQGQSYVNAINAGDRTRARELPAVEMGPFWFGHAAKYILNHPLDWLGLEFRKLTYLIGGYEISTDRPLYDLASRCVPLSLLLWDNFLSFPFGLILPLALLAPLTAPTRGRNQKLLSLSVVGLALAALALNPFAFQRSLFMPVVIMWAAAGFWGLIAYYQQQNFRSFYRSLIIVGVAIIVVNGVSHIPGFSPRIDSKFEGKMFEANALLTANRIDEARVEYENAIKLEPRSARPYSSLAGIYGRQGNDSLATLYYNRAVGLDPADDRPLRGIAALLRRRQKVGELNRLLVQVIRDYPKANWAYQEYAYLHIMLKEYTQAADIYERSFQADSTDFESIFRKGESYLNADMRQEAEQEFLRYLQYVPSSVGARSNLGQIYARQQRIDEAKREFEYVRMRQPGNPAVYFNLASLYYQTNDLVRAQSYLDTAAAIDLTFPGIDQMRTMIDSARTSRN
ncbi:MAG: tetratricopeptide repeat protein [Candidatus Zixiibacteriota bacterium]